VSAIVCIILCTLAMADVPKYGEIFKNRVDVYKSADNARRAVREVHTSARAFVFSGHQRYFERYALAETNFPYEIVDDYMRLAAPTPLTQYLHKRIEYLKQIIKDDPKSPKARNARWLLKEILDNYDPSPDDQEDVTRIGGWG